MQPEQSHGPISEWFTPYFYVESRGQGPFGLCSCRKCGAAVLIGTDEGNQEAHAQWHDMLTANLELPDLSQED